MNYLYSGTPDFSKGSRERLAEAGFVRTDDVEDADAVVTFCASQTALEDAYFDERGFVQAARPGTVLVDLSASTPSFARELNAVAVVSDLVFVEAPLVVGDMMAADAFSAPREPHLLCRRRKGRCRTRMAAARGAGGRRARDRRLGLGAAGARRVHAADGGAGGVRHRGGRALPCRDGLHCGPQPGGEARGGRVSAGGARACRHQRRPLLRAVHLRDVHGRVVGGAHGGRRRGSHPAAGRGCHAPAGTAGRHRRLRPDARGARAGLRRREVLCPPRASTGPVPNRPTATRATASATTRKTARATAAATTTTTSAGSTTLPTRRSAGKRA